MSLPFRLITMSAVACILSLAACAVSTDPYRFAMTVEVETPDGIRTGYSVYEVKVSRTVVLLPDGAKRDWSVMGEAVAVDLPNGQTLYALLRTDAHFGDMAGLSMATLHPDFRGTGYDVVGVAEELSPGRYLGPSQVVRENYPMLVTFANESDPTSVALVDPDDLAATFGEGVSLRRITLELTDDPVTRGIEERLGWLDNVYNMGSRMEDFPTEFPVGDFKGLFRKGHR